MGVQGPPPIRFGVFELHIRSGELLRKGSKINLQDQPFQALVLLLEHPGELVTREELRKNLWPQNTFVDFERGLNKAINKLRAALRDNADKPQYIETLPQRGYRFIAPIENAAPTLDPLRTPSAPRIDSIAVLPLENLSDDPAEEYFSDGMTEELICAIARIDSLRVISRTSAMLYKRSRKSLPEIAKELGKLGMTWSCNARANVNYETLKTMRDNGLRLLLVGYETGNQKILHNIKKGMRVDVARRFTKDCHELGITIHGTFILGLPGETRETIAETINFAKEINPHTIQVSLAAPYPGTELYRDALEHGWLDTEHAELVDASGVQIAPLHYPHLSHTEIFQSVEEFYRRFYFRAPKIAAIVSEMVRSPEMMMRRLREGVEFFSFLRERRELVH